MRTQNMLKRSVGIWTFDLLVTNPDAALELVPKNYENSSKSLCQSITYSITYFKKLRSNICWLFL